MKKHELNGTTTDGPRITAGLDLSTPSANEEGIGEIVKKKPNGGLTEPITGLEGYVPGVTSLGALSVQEGNVQSPQLDV